MYKRQQESKDAFHMISGTTGLQGAADTILVMTENKRGRDVYKRQVQIKPTLIEKTPSQSKSTKTPIKAVAMEIQPMVLIFS